MDNFYQLIQYIEYLYIAQHKGGHGIHSPFVFDLHTSVIESDKQYYSYEIMDDIRYTLLSDKSEIKINDLGAGSKKLKSDTRKLADVVRVSSIKPKYGRLLFRLVNYFQPQNILELGTCVGIGTAYMAHALRRANIYTIEGCANLSKIAGEVFKVYKLQNIKQIIGNFDDVLPQVLTQMQRVDFVFVDGNHQREAMLRYFNQILPYTHEKTVMIFDDIHWSEGTKLAWEEIKHHPRTTLTINIFQMGMVFFRPENKQKEHFNILF